MLTSSSFRPLFVLLIVVIVFVTLAAAQQASFTPGRVWLDDAGKPIQSHMGGVLFENGMYYWYGTDFAGPRLPPNTLPGQTFAWFLNLGVTVYSSRDLLHWHRESNQLADVTYGPGGLLQAANLLVRPKVIKNDATGKYILMAALTAPDFQALNDVVYAEADRPTGPFRFKGKLPWCGTPNATGLWTGPWAPGTGLPSAEWKAAAADPPERILAFDITLFKDGDGRAYLITAHSRVLMYELSSDYSCATRVEIMPGAEGEAPALFKDRGTYYLLASRLTGWAPNQNSYFTSSSVHGPWVDRGPFANGPSEQTTFNGQTTFVLPVAGQSHAFIFMADRFEAANAMDIPDFTVATHLWLPIEINPDNRALTVNWRSTWNLPVSSSAQ